MSHLREALSKLPAPFQGKPRIASFLSAITIQLDQIDKVIDHIALERDLDTCDRRNLEILADLVGEPNRPNSTELLRKLVKGRALVNASDGTINFLRTLHEYLFGVTGAIFQQLPPKYLQIRQPTSTVPLDDAVDFRTLTRWFLEQLQQAADPGLMIEILYVPLPESQCTFPTLLVDGNIPEAIRL